MMCYRNRLAATCVSAEPFLWGRMINTQQLEKHIKWSKYILAGIVLLTVGAYILNFSSEQFSADPGAWGQFGDYLGGVMNPFMAFGAFYWLATSVLLQKNELSETRAALQASQKEQQKQAATALHAAQIQTLNIKLSVTAGLLAQLYSYRTQLYLHQGSHGPARTYYDEDGLTTSVREVIKNVLLEIGKVEVKHVALIREIESSSKSFFESSSLTVP